MREELNVPTCCILPSSSKAIALKKVLTAITLWNVVLETPWLSNCDYSVDYLILFLGPKENNYSELLSIFGRVESKILIIGEEGPFDLSKFALLLQNGDIRMNRLAMHIFFRIYHHLFKNRFLSKQGGEIEEFIQKYRDWLAGWHNAGGGSRKNLTERLKKGLWYLESYKINKISRRAVVDQIGRINSLLAHELDSWGEGIYDKR